MMRSTIGDIYRAEFERNKLSHLVTVYHADICQSREETTDAISSSGLDPIISPLKGKVDAVSISRSDDDDRRR